MAVTVPEPDLKRIQRYCESRVPEEVLDKVRVTMKRRGRSVTIFDGWLAPLQGDGSSWLDKPVAQLRYDDKHAGWTLYWADRNGRWHLYDLVEPHQPVGVLLGEIERDPTCIFWG